MRLTRNCSFDTNVGTKGTGNGHREAGIAGLDVFTEWKSIYVDYSGRLQRAQIDTDALTGATNPPPLAD